MSVTLRERIRCWLSGRHRYESVTTDRWPRGHHYRLCRACGADRKWRPWHPTSPTRGGI